MSILSERAYLLLFNFTFEWGVKIILKCSPNISVVTDIVQLTKFVNIWSKRITWKIVGRLTMVDVHTWLLPKWVFSFEKIKCPFAWFFYHIQMLAFMLIKENWLIEDSCCAYFCVFWCWLVVFSFSSHSKNNGDEAFYSHPFLIKNID